LAPQISANLERLPKCRKIAAMQIQQATLEAPSYMSLKNVPRRHLTLASAVNDGASFDDGGLGGAPAMATASSVMGLYLDVSTEPDEHTGRRDALPEHYGDTGCDLSPSCLTCPLAHCRYDAGVREQRQDDRQQRIVELRRQGWTPERVAAALGVSRRTVFRLSKV
jgi:hypothetical protein